VNLCFHGVGVPKRELQPGEAPYWISADFFAEVLDYASTRHNVALSFDDGNDSDSEIALPVLRAKKLRAAFFPVADRIGLPGSVDRSGLRALAASGMTIGSHGLRHQPWRGMNDEQLDGELVEARRLISEAAGVPVTAAACPLGRYDRKVLGRLRRLGYAQVFTSDRAVARPSGWLQPRFSIRESDDLASVRALCERTTRRDDVLARARIAAKRVR
jgi:peptidoglycan/xylan/chitin deacetylase (PgdA/CDA1 family)